MTQINDGGAAFPIPNDDRPGAYSAEPGMSLRDWFAGQAMAGLLAAKGYHLRQVAAIDAYNIADAMLAARTTPETSA